MKNTIQFTVVVEGHNHSLSTYPDAYPNVMTLIKDQLLLDDFGECGGMGRCATCVINTQGLSGESTIKERNEPATLHKYGLDDPGTRLSCQLFVSPDLEGTELTLIEV
ncbi:2Fe-2S iron-sulfur cluster-binding protein [Reichenbachiella carrageenanivorans]|uniref:2Fe-2S iron-sulfur cluster-binding protein n=1 Tax=Reichenbachiella carrageenanivorans TaxID=2979869 RepID=A0ABY6CYQ9_9BACT|nr:2Fe-2S iron-sulfur cluster-binding protein [Reichenbachiella carrageenanivorans]UXX79042.1 2Fe-2S iron-sulfur cluster-binding protein [Reichenbachiella carrageenanivorans]